MFRASFELPAIPCQWKLVVAIGWTWSSILGPSKIAAGQEAEVAAKTYEPRALTDPIL